ncbi:MAG: 2-C-methyl-D-erythritol 4-phosphate cytidylyltransferase [Oscillospiraceae bacterium]|nr:2-C-methyl-D-erythritol 4-phosphate cytidylyltransferase [Oscillospiraceae bacterium]
MTWAVLVAAGRGNRMGAGRNKALLPLAGVPVLVRTARALALPQVAGLVAVAAAGEETEVRALLAAAGIAAQVVHGGADRQASVRAGLAAVPRDADLVLVHDAARPLVTPRVILAALDSAARHGSGVAAVPLKDTVKRVDGRGAVLDTPARDTLRAVQTPQIFAAELLRRAHSRALAASLAATDDAALVEALGETVYLTEGDVENIKITTPEDMALAESILARRGEAAQAHPRVGHGYDAHRLAEGRALVLCGVRIPFEKGLLGHSDADVAAHALCDALLGAAGLGDIGRHFPDTDPAYEDADSLQLLARVGGLVRRAGFVLSNADVTIVAQRPRLRDWMPQMAENLARALDVDAARLSVKATTTEGMGFEGEGLGISAQAVALLLPLRP